MNFKQPEIIWLNGMDCSLFWVCWLNLWLLWVCWFVQDCPDSFLLPLLLSFILPHHTTIALSSYLSLFLRITFCVLDLFPDQFFAKFFFFFPALLFIIPVTRTINPFSCQKTPINQNWVSMKNFPCNCCLYIHQYCIP